MACKANLSCVGGVYSNTNSLGNVLVFKLGYCGNMQMWELQDHLDQKQSEQELFTLLVIVHGRFLLTSCSESMKGGRDI